MRDPGAQPLNAERVADRRADVLLGRAAERVDRGGEPRRQPTGLG